MQIFVSIQSDFDKEKYKAFYNLLKAKGHNVYFKSVKSALGAPGLYKVDALDYFFRDEDMAIAFLTNSYLSDTWLVSELHALYTLQNSLEKNFILPILFEDTDIKKVPDICLVNEYVRQDKNEPYENLLNKFIEKFQNFAKRKLAIFISHSSDDEPIARALTVLLEKAYHLNSKDIICTSVSEHKLPLSANTNETLLRKIFEAKVFICIGTENSLGTDTTPGSFYVSAELGARWGMKRYLAIMLASGATGGLLKAPFNTLNVLSCEDSSQVRQFVEQIGSKLELDLKPEDESDYSRLIDKLVEVSRKPLS